MIEGLVELKVVLQELGFRWDWKESDGVERFVVADETGDEIDSRFLYEFEEKDAIEYELLRACTHWTKEDILKTYLFLKK